ncbi:MAG: ATPase domain-containing protein [Phycisphaerae bacterium]
MAEIPKPEPSGLPGLDTILRGGFPKGMSYLVHGGPGTGKTTLGLQFLMEGLRRGQRVMYVSLLQNREELSTIAASHGWTLDGIEMLELPREVREAATDAQTLFSAVDVELQEVTRLVLEGVKKHNPDRLLFDSLTELAVLVENEYQLRRHLFRIERELTKNDCTTLYTINQMGSVDLIPIQTVLHGDLEMMVDRGHFSPNRRRLEVTKMRGVSFLEGAHDLRIRTGGVEIYPRLEVLHKATGGDLDQISSGNEALDAMFGGGLEEGTACLALGTTGAGKSTLATVYAIAAAERQVRSAIFCFDERRQTFIHRAEGLEMNLQEHLDSGMIELHQLNVGNIPPGEFSQRIRHSVEEEGVRIVVIDSLTGYMHAMGNQASLLPQLHDLLSFLAGKGVLTFLILATHGAPGRDMDVDFNASYIADTVVFLRHFEAMGKMRRCISVIKKRHSPHENYIREIMPGPGGLQVGPPLSQFRNVLSGTPEFIGDVDELLESDGDHAF